LASVGVGEYLFDELNIHRIPFEDPYGHHSFREGIVDFNKKSESNYLVFFKRCQ